MLKIHRSPLKGQRNGLHQIDLSKCGSEETRSSPEVLLKEVMEEVKVFEKNPEYRHAQGYLLDVSLCPSKLMQWHSNYTTFTPKRSFVHC